MLTQKEEKKHSPIGASIMHRWSQCPGSVRLCEGVEPTTSVYAEEGIEAHEWAEKLLSVYLDFTRSPESRRHEAEHIESKIDPEMFEAVQVYVNHVLALDENAEKTLIEQSFNLSNLYPNLYGTADAVVYRIENSDKNNSVNEGLTPLKVLHVIDYKHGAGVPVEVKDNMQLMYYGLGALMSTGLPCDKVVLTVVQPRCYHVDGPIRSDEKSVTDIIEFAADLVDYAKKTAEPNAPLREGKHCRFCPAAPICPELRKTALEKAREEFSVVSIKNPQQNTAISRANPAVAYSPTLLNEALEMAPLVEAWAKSVREFAYNEAMRGVEIPGHKLVEKQSRRKWKNEDEAAQYLKLLGLEDEVIYEKNLKSAPSFDKIIKSKKDREAISHLIESVSSGLTLVHESDKRKPITLKEYNSAEKDFKKITDESTG